MTSTKWIGAALAIFVAVGAAHARELSSVATEDLISKLQDESAEGIGTDQTVWASGFVAIHEEPKFNGGILGSPEPATSPVMRELVRRGAAALPMLIGHLSDARPTKLTVDRGEGKWFGKEYDPRYRDPAKLPPGVDGPGADSGGPEAKGFRSYTVKVGDFCFVAVGQIVNRQLNAVRYQPTLCLVVNSPVETPALAAAVKADWGGLTSAEHQRSLEDDASQPLRDGDALPSEAVKRLLFYYPEAGAAVAVRLLNSPLCDNSLIYEFVEKRLLKAKDDQQQDRLMADFRKENGEGNYGAMQSFLISYSESPKTREGIDAVNILARAFPGVDSKHPPAYAGTGFYSLNALVDALATFPSAALNEAVYNLLKRVSAMHLASAGGLTNDWRTTNCWRISPNDANWFMPAPCA